ncbi:DUF6255 family natural product biosynthesis protein [Streptomyces sp. QH1-20]|uniref:DUF6255 family natural product biosynthesis protein n=1 Tax=Streptomyces sp. QH1-20 TaxID=3240934 RepID=UPI0035198C13
MPTDTLQGPRRCAGRDGTPWNSERLQCDDVQERCVRDGYAGEPDRAGDRERGSAGAGAASGGWAGVGGAVFGVAVGDAGGAGGGGSLAGGAQAVARLWGVCGVDGCVAGGGGGGGRGGGRGCSGRVASASADVALAGGGAVTVAVLSRECGHGAGWRHTGGEARCGACGVVRFTEYGALRPPGLPQVVTPVGSARRADRSAARVVSRTVRRPAWWGQRPGGA